jgi:hypothetical protein
MTVWLADLHRIRRALMTLAILFFTIMLLEVDLGHAPAIARHSWLALLPVVWLPLTLLALMAVQIKPSVLTMCVALAITTIAAAIGMIGSGLHMQAAGVDLGHISRVFSSEVWGGRESPNWPVAITLAAVFGLAAAFNAHRDNESLTRDLGGTATAVAYILIVAGVVCATMPVLTTISAACLAIASLLLLAVLVAILSGTAMERSLP